MKEQLRKDNYFLVKAVIIMTAFYWLTILGLQIVNKIEIDDVRFWVVVFVFQLGGYFWVEKKYTGEDVAIFSASFFFVMLGVGGAGIVLGVVLGFLGLFNFFILSLLGVMAEMQVYVCIMAVRFTGIVLKKVLIRWKWLYGFIKSIFAVLMVSVVIFCLRDNIKEKPDRDTRIEYASDTEEKTEPYVDDSEDEIDESKKEFPKEKEPTYNQKEYKELKNFASKLEEWDWNENEPEKWLGITWEVIENENRVIEINISDNPYVEGELDLSEFSKLEAINLSGTNISKVILPSHLEVLEDHTFYNCVKLKSIILPKKLESIGEGVFKKCESLTSIEIPGKLQYVSMDVFDECKNLREIIFKGAAPEKIECLWYLNYDGMREDVKIYYNPSEEGWEKLKGKVDEKKYISIKR